jgi:MFS family permease
MPISLLPRKFTGVFTRPALVSVFLLTNAFVWYSYALVILQQSISALNLDFLPNMIVWSTHFIALIVSALLGTNLTKKIGGRKRFLAIWILIGAVASLSPFALKTTDSSSVVALGIVFGFSLGFGMPNCMGYFTSQVPVENRARIGGAIILFTGLGNAGLDFLGINGIVELAISLAIWRAIALMAVAFAKPKIELEHSNRALSYRAIFNQRPFILYFIPWILFALLNYLTTPVQQNILTPSLFYNLQILENVLMGAFALIGGILMDSIGRKRMAIIGFVMLGLSYSFLGFFNETPFWYIHTIMVGISWGILYVLFVVTIWGDLSHSNPSDKFYALGVSPFFISKMLQLIINSQIVAAIPISSIFSFIGIFLFLAVLPLIYAPETLPEKVMKDRDLNSYIEKAKRIVEKETKKSQKQESRTANNENQESAGETQESPEDKKAQELAEKYY